MDVIDYIIIGGLAFCAIMLPVGIILSGQTYDEWESTIDIMDCKELKEQFVQGTFSVKSVTGGDMEQQLGQEQETELMKRIIAQDCI